MRAMHDAPAPWTRWAAAAGTVALGAALLVTLGLGAAHSGKAADQLQAQQLGQLRGGLARAVRHVRDPGEALAELVEDEAEAGLRGVALLDPAGVVATAGELSRAPADIAQLRPPHFERDGDLVRSVLPLRRPRGQAGRRRGAVQRFLYVELEPRQANALRASGQRALLAGVGASGGLLALAVFLWRRSLAAEQAAQHLAEQRHLAQLGTLSAVLGHELRNPLTSLKGNAQLLARKLPEGPQADKAHLIVAEAVRLERLTTRILAFARTGIQREPTDVAPLVQSVVERVDGVELVAAPSTAWNLDSDWVEQAIENLLRNAVQADPDGRATLTVTADDTLRFAVSDRGPGIPADQRRWALEAFHTDKVQGTGLGLAIARRVAEQHGGRIEIADAPQTGALVTLVIGKG